MKASGTNKAPNSYGSPIICWVGGLDGIISHLKQLTAIK